MGGGGGAGNGSYGPCEPGQLRVASPDLQSSLVNSDSRALQVYRADDRPTLEVFASVFFVLNGDWHL